MREGFGKDEREGFRKEGAPLETRLPGLCKGESFTSGLTQLGDSKRCKCAQVLNLGAPLITPTAASYNRLVGPVHWEQASMSGSFNIVG